MSTATLLPLPDEEVDVWLLAMLEDNGGCRLPCWWGITPGETTWEEARAFLAPYASRISVHEIGGRVSIAVYFFYPPESVTTSFITLNFGVMNGIINGIAINNIELVSAYNLSELMETYGEPGSVFIDAYSGWENDYGPRHVAIHIYYPQHGIFAQYDAPNGEVGDGILHNCIEYGPLLLLWSPERQLNYADAIVSLGLDFQFPFLPVSEALGMDVPTFYETYRGADREVCIDTPVDLWIWGATMTPTP
jgi:hypothetical protein